MKTENRILRVQAMMYRFFSLYENQNKDFDLVRELLFEENFEWLSPSGNLIGVEAFKESFYNLDKTRRHSHRPEEMKFDFIDDETVKLRFNYTYQNLQGDKMALHAKGHYELICIDRGDRFPKIQKCNLTLLSLVEGGEFRDLYKENNEKYVEFYRMSMLA